METIPQEIFLNILEYVAGYPKEFLPYVTVSRRWQRTIEPWYYKALRIKNSDLPTFATLFRALQGHRKALVKEVYLDVVLPNYDEEVCQQHAETNNRVFSAAVSELFQVLESFNEDCNVQGRGGLHLNLRDVSSQSDRRLPRIHQRKLWSTFIQLLDHDKLPSLSCVSRFQCGFSFQSRKFDPPSMMYLAGKLKGLKTCRIDYCNDRDCFDDEVQRDIRHEYAKALSAYPHSLDELLIEFRPTAPLDEATSPPNLIPLTTAVDPLNLAMHKVIQKANVTYVSLSAQHVISPDFFWPYGGVSAPSNATPFWPRLKTVRIVVSPVSPDGDWYFIPDLNVASYAEFTGAKNNNNNNNNNNTLEKDEGGKEKPRMVNSFRSVPNPEKMNPLLIAMGKAIRYAPSLQEISLRFGRQRLTPKSIKKQLNVDLNREFNITYFASGVIAPNRESESTEKPRLICQVQDWRPNDTLEGHWREALGLDVVMVYE